MKVPAVTYKQYIYTAPTGHIDALARLLTNHGPKAANPHTLDEWARQQLEARTIRYGWLVDKRFEERS